MSQRVCANCGHEIAEEPQVLFCDRHCCIEYLNNNDGLPTEPVTA